MERVRINWRHVGLLGGLLGVGLVLSAVEAHLDRLVLIVVLALPYLLPTLVALARHHRQRQAIAALNILLGWTFVGWVVALVWALTVSPGTPDP
jgi:Superinfection immunity protein